MENLSISTFHEVKDLRTSSTSACFTHFPRRSGPYLLSDRSSQVSSGTVPGHSDTLRVDGIPGPNLCRQEVFGRSEAV